MKKNRMMRLASLLLVCVLLTTSVISGTYAKYVTTGSTSDSARVAKFGVKIDGEVGDSNQMFSKEYAKAVGETYTGSVTVSAATNVVAPGTSGTLSKFTVTGTPEVAVRVSYTPTVELGNNWIDKDDNTKFYCPIIVTVTVNGTPTSLSGLDYDNADAFEGAIEALITSAKMDYAPGNLTVVDDDLKVEWKWEFFGATGLKNNQTDEKDTFLGDRAVEEANAGTIDISIICTVEQID